MNENSLALIKTRLKVTAERLGIMPSICKRGAGEAKNLQELGIKVADWSELRQNRELLQNRLHGSSMQLGNSLLPPQQQQTKTTRRLTIPAGRNQSRGQIVESQPKAKSGGKNPKAAGGGRTYTSRFRGVHQTFPTKRWEAQFRRSGKPTTLGCFDHEEEAARA